MNIVPFRTVCHLFLLNRCLVISGILKKQWEIIDKSTEHDRKQLVGDVHVCTIFHNLLLRFHANPELDPTIKAAWEIYYRELVASVDLMLLLEPQAAAAAADGAAVGRPAEAARARREAVVDQVQEL